MPLFINKIITAVPKRLLTDRFAMITIVKFPLMIERSIKYRVERSIKYRERHVLRTSQRQDSGVHALLITC